MHELALCDAMLKMVRDISREQALEGVRSITVRVGTLSGVVPRFLTDCWVAVTDGTEYDGVPLRVETEAGRARCLDCGAEFVADVERGAVLEAEFFEVLLEGDARLFEVALLRL